MIYHDSAVASYCKNHSLLAVLWEFLFHMYASQQLALKKCKNIEADMILNLQRCENEEVQE